MREVWRSFRVNARRAITKCADEHRAVEYCVGCCSDDYWGATFLSAFFTKFGESISAWAPSFVLRSSSATLYRCRVCCPPEKQYMSTPR